ncbi:hypothetical protein AB0B07_07765 [Streptomyces sioyaensis]|uniref:hypothetical protein n=1 Tax=Streptomyces sioyaensis TaxID=67364 RepID=UPI0033DF99EA
MKNRRDYRDVTMERATSSRLDYALSMLHDQNEVDLVILMLVFNLSARETALRLQITECSVMGRLHRAMAKLRHTGQTISLKDELEDGRVPRAAEFRGRVDELAESILVTCPQCNRPFFPENKSMATGGRPRRYCSNSCRQAAYRKRQQ